MSALFYFSMLSRITNSPIADVFVVWAKCEDGKIRGFILEKVGICLYELFCLRSFLVLCGYFVPSTST